MTKKSATIYEFPTDKTETLKQYTLFEISSIGENILNSTTRDTKLEERLSGVWESFPGLRSRTVSLFSFVSNIWPYGPSKTLCLHALERAVEAYQKEKRTLHRDDPYAVYLGTLLEEVSAGLMRYVCIGRDDFRDLIFEPGGVSGTLETWAKASGIHTVFFEPMMRIDNENDTWALKMKLAACLLTPGDVKQMGLAGFPVVPLNTIKERRT